MVPMIVWELYIVAFFGWVFDGFGWGDQKNIEPGLLMENMISQRMDPDSGTSSIRCIVFPLTYPLVNVYILPWKDPPFLMGKSTISMAIFNCYVKLPEGSFRFSHHLALAGESPSAQQQWLWDLAHVLVLFARRIPEAQAAAWDSWPGDRLPLAMGSGRWGAECHGSSACGRPCAVEWLVRGGFSARSQCMFVEK